MSANNDLSKEQMEQLAGVFRAEATEHIKSLAGVLFALEDGDIDNLSEGISKAFRDAHSLKGSAGTLGFDRVAVLTHRFEDALGELKKGETNPTGATIDCLLQTLESIRNAVMTSLPGDGTLSDDEIKIMGMLDKHFPNSRHSEPPPPEPQPESEPRPEPPQPAAPSVPAAPMEYNNKEEATEEDSSEPEQASQKQSSKTQEFIRVSQDRIDAVINRFGELLETGIHIESFGQEFVNSTIESERISEGLSALFKKLDGTELEESCMDILESARNLHAILNATSSRFIKETTQFSKLLNRSQDVIQEIRIAPVSTIFIAMKSQVREISRALNRKVDLALEGGEYAVDRNVLDAIEEPLIHAIRNAIDHGIEDEDQRIKNGKSATGHLTIAAIHTGDSVEIRITDDGKGIDPKKIKTALKSKYNLSDEKISKLTNEQLFDYLFESGFSTHKGVSQVSGRGVGLDVVKYSIERLGGEVRLISKLGTGSTLIFRLPLIMSTVRCLLVKTADRIIAIPASNVTKVLVLKPTDITVVGGGQNIEYLKQNIPIATLSGLLELRNETLTSKITNICKFAAIISFGDRHFAFAFDELLEYTQLVIKPLGDLLERVPNLSGLSLLSSGEMAIVLNPADVIRTAGGISTTTTIASESASTKTKLRVLVADDSIATRTLEKSLLESAGFSVVTATDGLKALNYITNDPVDLVVSDIQMPNMSGLELTRSIRSKPHIKHIPVILISSLGSDEDKAQGLAVGADAYIVKKELTRTELINTINQLL